MRNNKTLFVLCFLFCVSFLGKAQSDYGNVRLGFQFTPTISWMKSDVKQADNNGPLMGYNFGLMGDFFFAPNYAFTTGFQIERTGGNLMYHEKVPFSSGGQVEDLDAETSVRYKLNYVKVPVGIKLLTNESRGLAFWGTMGLTPMVCTNATDKDDNNIKDEVRSFNVGYNFGGGIQYFLRGQTALTVGLVYTHGLTDVTSNEAVKDRTIIHNLNFSLGLMF